MLKYRFNSKIRVFALIALMMISYSAVSVVRAVSLPELEAGEDKVLPIDSTAPDVPCDQIQQRLESFHRMSNDHHSSVATFLGQVEQKLNEWHSLLSPLEETNQNLPAGTFWPLQDGAQKVAMITDRAWENSFLLANELDRIIFSLRSCALTPKPAKP